MTALADRALADHPAWMTMLGPQPDDARARAQWRRHVAIIAAYRDQHRVTADDPRQLLGPYPSPGHAGHPAYWHAAESVLTARHLTSLDHSARRRGEADARTVTDIYKSLHGDERAVIAKDIAADAGILWFGDHNDPDEHAVTQPAYTDRLTTTLAKRGHLTRDNIGHHVVAEEPVEATFARRTRPRTGTRATTVSEAGHGADARAEPQTLRPPDHQVSETSPPTSAKRNGFRSLQGR